MGNKIIITEEQLKRLVERKHNYSDNTPEGEVAEQEEVSTEEEMEIDLEDGGDDSEITAEDAIIKESIKNIQANFKRFL